MEALPEITHFGRLRGYRGKARTSPPNVGTMPRRLSTVRGREFGEGLRAAVQRSTLNGREIAGMLGWDQGKLSDLLSGKGGSTELEVVSSSACVEHQRRSGTTC